MTAILTALFLPSVTIRRLFSLLLCVLLVMGLLIATLPSNHIDTGLEIKDKVFHIAAFFSFAVLLDIASRKNFWRWQAPLLLVYGAMIELLQSFVSWRTFSLLDLIADTIGILLYWLLVINWLKPLILARGNQQVA